MSGVLVLGGYGNFGKRIAELLVRQGIEVTIAGRDRVRAEACVASIGVPGIEIAIFDIERDLAGALERIGPLVVIDTVGPFQQRGYDAARACIARKIHYVDLSDGRDYAGGITALDAAARENDVLAVSGASTVPALTSAVVEHFLPRFSAIDFLDFGIAPGQRAERGLATTEAILGYVGKRLKPCAGYPRRYGWQDLHRQSYPGLGSRWMANCDVPDLDLLPPRYGIGRIRFSAGMELAPLHLGLWGLSWLVRAGLPLKLDRFVKPMLAISNLFNGFGSADGGMHVLIEGRDHDGQPLSIGWFIVAKQGHGPYIPAVPSVVLATQLVAGTHKLRGAYPCVGLVGLDDYLTVLQHLDVSTVKDARSGVIATISPLRGCFKRSRFSSPRRPR